MKNTANHTLFGVSGVIRAIVASLLTVLILAATIPSLGRIRTHIDPGGYVTGDIIWISLVIVPYALVLVGIRRRSFVEVIGWIAILLVLMLVLIG